MLVIILLFILYPASSLAQTEVRVTGVRLNHNSLIMEPGSTEILYAVVSPNNATNKEISWSTSDPMVIQVTDLGDIPAYRNAAEIKALSPGRATVTVITEEGRKRVDCQVEVIVPVTSISLKTTEITLSPSQELWLQAQVEPRDATNQQLTWSSTNPAVAFVDANGLVKAKKAGEARIVIRAVEDDTLTAYCNVTVSDTAVTAERDLERTEDPELVEQPQELVPELQPEPKQGGSLPVIGLAAGAVIILGLIVFFIWRGQGQRSAAAVPPAGSEQFKPRPFIMGISGQFAGQRFDLVRGRLVIGRDSSSQLVYPTSQEEISRKHCTVMYDEAAQKFILEDSSSNGTYLSSGERLFPGEQYQLNWGERFYLAQPGELFETKVE
ncbi:Ig-like domain-containing protein [Candidatus Contubernalis alkaliaceticus]|uniref:Ig-like domain-containing protein n=1 Tax=Candidatus Contubernalis alkaliaceticus TaxID=338645 RepID=UPI001F4C2E3E|nr:Ig-like domain-containing protein [Candidatus Contubernalis alkalaceticus]